MVGVQNLNETVNYVADIWEVAKPSVCDVWATWPLDNQLRVRSPEKRYQLTKDSANSLSELVIQSKAGCNL